MSEVSVVGPDGGETIRLGRAQMRILEDGSTTGHRLGIGEITLAPHTEGPRSTGTPSTTRASTSSPAPCTSPSGKRFTSPRPALSR